MLVATTHQLEQQIGVAIGVRQVADLVDQQQIGRGLVAQAAPQGRIAVQRRQIAQQMSGGDEERRGAGQYRLIAQVAGKHRLAQTVAPDQHHVGCIGNCASLTLSGSMLTIPRKSSPPARTMSTVQRLSLP